MNLKMDNPHDQDRIDEEAVDWLVRREEQEPTREEQSDFEAWCARDPRHGETYQELVRTWNDVSQLTDLAAIVAVPEAPAATPIRRWSRGRGLAALTAAAAAILALIWLPTWLEEPGAPTRYETQVAEIRKLTLPDGTRVTLGPRSHLETKFSEGERRVALSGGAAFFEVTRNPERPFLVEAGPSVIRVVGTKFDVNTSGGTVRVAVLEGKVQVTEVRPRSAGAGSAPRTLVAGEQIEVIIAPAAAIDRAAPAATVTVPEASSTEAGGWREGRLSYDNARLADLIADVNRYYAPGVTLADPAAGELRVTASFRTNEIPAFMTVVGQVVPVEVSKNAKGDFTVKSAKN